MASSSLLRQQFESLDTRDSTLLTNENREMPNNTTEPVSAKGLPGGLDESEKSRTKSDVAATLDGIGMSSFSPQAVSPDHWMSMSSSYADHPLAPPPSAAGGAQPTQTQLSTPSATDNHSSFFSLGRPQRPVDAEDEVPGYISPTTRSQGQDVTRSKQAFALGSKGLSGSEPKERTTAGTLQTPFYDLVMEKRGSTHSMLDADKVSRKLDETQKMQDRIAFLEQELEHYRNREDRIISLEEDLELYKQTLHEVLKGNGLQDRVSAVERNLEACKETHTKEEPENHSSLTGDVQNPTVRHVDILKYGRNADILLQFIPLLKYQNPCVNETVYATFNAQANEPEDEPALKMEKMEVKRKIVWDLSRIWRPLADMPEALARHAQRLDKPILTSGGMWAIKRVRTPAEREVERKYQAKVKAAADDLADSQTDSHESATGTGAKTSGQATRQTPGRHDMEAGTDFDLQAEVGDQAADKGSGEGSLARQNTAFFSPGCHIDG